MCLWRQSVTAPVTIGRRRWMWTRVMSKCPFGVRNAPWSKRASICQPEIISSTSWPGRLAVKTQIFQICDRSSTLRQATDINSVRERVMVTYAEMAAVNNRLAALAEIVRLMNGRIDNDAEAINGLFEAAVVSLGTARGLAKLLEELAVQVQH